MTERITILWHSNMSGTPTGYGNQTGLFIPKLEDAGFTVHESAFYGIQGAPIVTPSGRRVYPVLDNVDPYGNLSIAGHMQHSHSDAIISLIDPFVLETEIWGKLPWYAWVPVDCAPVAPENLAVIQYAKRVWAMSKFGESQLKLAGLPNVDYVPHGIDTNVYQPIDRAEARERLGKFVAVDLKNRFIVITVAANKGTPSRKNFAGMLRAFKQFSSKHPDALFYMHTNPGEQHGGDHLLTIIDAYGLTGKVIFPPQYSFIHGLYGPDLMNDIYNAADLFMLLSFGEGFGIPIMEAQAAGCPVIVTDGSAMSELCLSGWKVQSIPIQALQGRFGCMWFYALEPHAVQCLEEAYNKLTVDSTRDSMRKLARVKAMQYDVDAVFNQYMLPAIEQIETDIQGEKKRIDDKRAERKLKRAKLRAMKEADDKPEAETPEAEKEPAVG